MEHEQALVLLLGRLHFDELSRTRIFHIIKNGVDWYAFLNYCIKSNMVCLVYRNMINLGIERLLPAIVMNNMKYHYEQNTARNKKLIKCYEKIVKDLAENDIHVLPSKGIRFLTTIYRNDPGIRLLNDIDIFALPSDKESVHNYMEATGFETYLINDKDAFCSPAAGENSRFYIFFTEEGGHDDIRVDIDYTCPEHLFAELSKDGNHLSEFCILCNIYSTAMCAATDFSTLKQSNYIRLVDLAEYYRVFLSSISKSELLDFASKLNMHLDVSYIVDFLDMTKTCIIQ